MTSFLHRFVSKRLSRFRICTAYLLGMVALALVLGLGKPASVATVAADGEDVLAPDALAGLVVVLDPGHGGYDGGARAQDSGIWEKEVTLQIAQAVEKELTAHGAKVVLTRREDVALCDGDTANLKRKRQDLQARVDIAKEADADVLLSIHLNEYRSRKESGPQVFYQRGGDDGRLLSGVLQKTLIEELNPKKERVAMAGDYYVLRSSIPSALVECGFLSNAEEEKLLLSSEYQEKIAVAIVKGLVEYKTLRERQGTALGGTTATQTTESPAAP